jgi:ornithine cyclodeaminase/alanine dehydrogenase-like protein (mu-crystallin family)
MNDQRVVILTASEIGEMLPMRTCIDLMEETLIDLQNGELHQPLRTIVKPEGARDVMGLMPCYRTGQKRAYGLKAICVFPDNVKIGKDGHQGAVLLFSGTTGELQAVLNASAITAIRTAAVSGVATRVLARVDACDLAIIGAGVEARTHLEAIRAVRELKRVRVVSRNEANAKRFADEVGDTCGVAVEPLAHVEQAIKGADLIVTCTTSSKPVIDRAWISEGAHINAVGACFPAAREIDSATMAAARLFVDRRESTLKEAGDYLIAAAEGAISEQNIKAELGEVLSGTKAGRCSDNEITLFKSLGIAVEDLACAEYLFEQAMRNNAGTVVKF